MQRSSRGRRPGTHGKDDKMAEQTYRCEQIGNCRDDSDGRIISKGTSTVAGSFQRNADPHLGPGTNIVILLHAGETYIPDQEGLGSRRTCWSH